MKATIAKKYTAQEYLDLEVVASERHEYINGEIKLSNLCRTLFKNCF